MDRRTAVRTVGLAVLGTGLGGCASSRARTPASRLSARLPLVNASRDQVIRTTVGLRPFRPAGFRVERERFDEKTIIHNYGHGGAGMSLSWGTGLLAAELAEDHPSRDAAVVGCGVAGLAAARQLQRRGYAVTIYAKAIPPDTTSNMSLASFTPLSNLVSAPERTTPWEAQFDRAVRISYRELQLLAGAGHGISWVPTYTWTDRLTNRNPAPIAGETEPGSVNVADLEVGATLLQPGEHPFPARYAHRRPSLRIEPSIYLDYLVREYLLFGGEVVIREFATLRDLMSLDEPLVINCTGLGSRSLFADRTMSPIKGQLTFLAPQREVDYHVEGSAPGGGRIGVLPRSDGIALGHLMERDEWSLEPNREHIAAVLDRATRLFSAMAGNDRSTDLIAHAPVGHPDAGGDDWLGAAPPVESFYDLES